MSSNQLPWVLRPTLASQPDPQGWSHKKPQEEHLAQGISLLFNNCSEIVFVIFPHSSELVVAFQSTVEAHEIVKGMSKQVHLGSELCDYGKIN